MASLEGPPGTPWASPQAPAGLEAPFVPILSVASLDNYPFCPSLARHGAWLFGQTLILGLQGRHSVDVVHVSKV